MPSNEYYDHTTYPGPNAPGSSAALRAELDAIEQGFLKLPTLSGNGNKVVVVDAAGLGMTTTLALNGLSLNSTTIGATTPAAGWFTSLSATGVVSLGSNVSITGGTINNTQIGNTTPSSAAFTTVSASSGFTGNLSGNVSGNLTGNVTGNVAGDLTGNVNASSGTSTFNNVTINGTLNMDAGTAGTITGLSAPTNASDAATKSYVDTQDALKLNLSGGTMSGNIAMGSNRVTGLAEPASAQDAATKNYVDSVAQGLDVKPSVRAATTTNIILSGTQTVDGVALIVGDRVLVKNQSTPSQNGVYVVAAGAWTRPVDMDAWTKLPGAFTFVEEGSTNDNSGWVCTVAAGGTLGSTSVTFEQFSGAGQITAGAGMTKSGNTLDVGTASASRIVVNTDSIDLATTGVAASTYRSVTVDVYGRVTGGTNPTTVSGYGITDAYTKTEVDTALGLKLSLTGGTMSGAIAMGSNKITGLGNPTLAQDAATKNYIDTIFGSTASAAASASAAAASELAAAGSATNASNSASAALTSANNAAASYDSFDDRYLGAKASDPTLDNDGNALLVGAIYWNTASSIMKVWDGAAWSATFLPATGYLSLSGGTMTGNITFAGTQALFLGTTSVSLNRTSGALSLAGVSIDGSAGSATTATTATHIAGGAANQIPYQSGAGATTFVSAPTVTDTYLRWNGSAFVWSAVTGATGGTVTSVGITSTDLTVTNTPVTVSGNINLSLNTVGISKGGTGQTTAVAAFDALAPTTTLGDLIFHDGTDNVRLAGNTVAGRRFLRQTGTGSVSAAPAWDGLVDGDIPSALTGKTYNGLTLTAAATGFTVAGGTTSKTLTVSNTLTLSGTDGSTLNIGGGGTLGTGAYATIANYATLDSPTFTGTPAAPTAAADTNTTQIATTAYVIGQASSTNPVVDGTAAVGTSLRYARADHVHPTDTSRAPSAGSASITTVGTVTSGTWNAATIEIAYGGTGATTKAAGFNALSPVTTLGDIIFGDAANSNTRLPGNTTTSKRFLTQTGTGSVSAAPGWNAIVDGDVPSALTGKTYNGLSLTANATGFSVAGGTTSKTLTVNNNLTLSGTDGSTLNIGGGGTLGTGAYATIASYATLASPTFTGTPAAPTAAADTNTTQIATTAFVVGQASSTTPAMDGTAAVGTSLRYARADHVHASDTSRAALAANTFTGDQTVQANLIFSGTSRRLQGDFSNATLASRTLVQTSTANSNTEFGAIPNGTATSSSFYLYNSSGAGNTGIGGISINASKVTLVSSAAGTGATLPIDVQTAGSIRATFGAAGGLDMNTGLRELRVIMGANDIDVRAGNYFTKTISGATTFTVSNVPSSGTAASFVLDLTNGGSATITWFSGVKWAGGTTPTLTASGRDVLGFFTHDAGTTWTGLLLGKDVK